MANWRGHSGPSRRKGYKHKGGMGNEEAVTSGRKKRSQLPYSMISERKYVFLL
jgi:hypothetical protein